MGLMDIAKASVKRITSDPDGWATPATFTTQDGLIKVTVNVIHRKVYMSMDTEGQYVNAKKAYVSVAESVLTDAGFPTRGVDNKCTMINCLVDANDSTGAVAHYIIREQYPDERLGLLVCILGDLQ